MSRKKLCRKDLNVLISVYTCTKSEGKNKDHSNNAVQIVQARNHWHKIQDQRKNHCRENTIASKPLFFYKNPRNPLISKKKLQCSYELSRGLFSQRKFSSFHSSITHTIQFIQQTSFNCYNIPRFPTELTQLLLGYSKTSLLLLEN